LLRFVNVQGTTICHLNQLRDKPLVPMVVQLETRIVKRSLFKAT